MTVQRQTVKFPAQRGNSSVGRARPCQGRGREFESRFPLHFVEKDWASCRNFFDANRGKAAICFRCLASPFNGGTSMCRKAKASGIRGFVVFAVEVEISGRVCQPCCRHRPGGRVVMQRTANPRTPVQFRPRPPMQASIPATAGIFVPAGSGAPCLRARMAKLVDARDLKSLT